jgi:hypothetical protein
VNVRCHGVRRRTDPQPTVDVLMRVERSLSVRQPLTK